jgi:thiol-disulfide isomerase/thioredoxin
MNADKAREYLETATNLTVLSVVLLIAGIFVFGFFSQVAAPDLQKGLQKGEAFAELQSFDYGESSRTLIVAINSQCGYCNESIPFYKRVMAAARGKNVRMVAVSEEGELAVKGYLDRSQLTVDVKAVTSLAAYGVATTPTVILVDDKGVVLDFWVGKVSAETERQIAEALLND